MKVYIASDHGGFEYKKELKKYLKGKGYEVEDLGAHEFDPKDDYADFVFPLALRVSKKLGSFGVVLGRSGNGEQITANKVKGIRAVLCFNEKMAQKAREHNDANVLSLGADYIELKEAKKIVEIFLSSPYPAEERHARRIGKITSYEETS